MAFFSFGKKLQLLLIMGALAAAPGCEEVQVMDPVPWPMCTEVETSSLTIFQTAGRFPTYADGSVTLNLPHYGNMSCNAPTPCISAVVNGSGTITQLEQPGRTSATFRYENSAMGSGETVPIDFTWRVRCTDADTTSEETVTGTAYACRDEMSGMLQIVGTSDECIPVVDPPPPPTALSDGGPKIAGTAMDGGKIMLTLPAEMRKAQKVIWEASAGSLQILSPDKAVFTPTGDRRIQVVQASIVTLRGVIIELYRYKA